MDFSLTLPVCFQENNLNDLPKYKWHIDFSSMETNVKNENWTHLKQKEIIKLVYDEYFVIMCKKMCVHMQICRFKFSLKFATKFCP